MIQNVQKSRVEDLNRFYSLMNQLKNKVGGYRYLSQCNGTLNWPNKGVYFFFEPGELRKDGITFRVVRVGTHAVSQGSKATLWNRLMTHRGNHSGDGNHRASIFRLLVGSALIKRKNYTESAVGTWGQGNSAHRDIRDNEREIERDVSEYIGKMPFLWVSIDDPPGTDSDRKYVERNSIGLLSGINGNIDSPSENWLGFSCKKIDVRESGLWNSDHVKEPYNPEFLDVLERYISSDNARKPTINPQKSEKNTQHVLESEKERKDNYLWLASITLRSDTFKFPDDDPEKNRAKNNDRYSALTKIITNLAHRFDGPGVVLFPGGYFHSGIEKIDLQGNSCLKKTINKVTTYLKNLESSHPNPIFAVIGIDGNVDLSPGVSYRYDRNQIAITVTKDGMVAFAKKFNLTDNVEKAVVDCSKDYMSREWALNRTWDRWFTLENKKFYLAVCNDIKGLPDNEKPVGIDYILNLVHGCYRRQDDGPTCNYFIRVGFGSASYYWRCPVFGAVVYFKRNIAEKWRSGMYYRTWDTVPVKCDTDDNSLMPIYSDDSTKLNEGFALVEVYNLNQLTHYSDGIPLKNTKVVPQKNNLPVRLGKINPNIEGLYLQLLSELKKVLGNNIIEQQTKITFRGKNVICYPGKKELDMISLFKPSKSNKFGVKFRIYSHLLAAVLNTGEHSVGVLLPEGSRYDKERDNPHTGEIFITGYFRNEEESRRFIEGVRSLSVTPND